MIPQRIRLNDAACFVVSIIDNHLYVVSLSIKSLKVSLPPATKLREGNVFIPVCDSVHRGGSLSRWGGLCPGVAGGGLCPGVGVSVLGWGSLSRGFSVQGVSVQCGSLSGRPPVWYCTGCTHPTRMHSCFMLCDYCISQSEYWKFSNIIKYCGKPRDFTENYFHLKGRALVKS